MEDLKFKKTFEQKKLQKAEKMNFSKGKKEKVIIDSLVHHHHDPRSAAMNGFLAEEKNKHVKKFKASKQQKDTAKSRAAKAGLHFPVARIHSKLKQVVPTKSRVGGTAAVFMAAVMEYLVAELCELAGNRAKGSIAKHKENVDGRDRKKRARITPRYIQFAIHEDTEFAQLLNRTWLPGGGVVPLDDKKLKAQINANKSTKKLMSHEQEIDALEDADFSDDDQ